MNFVRTKLFTRGFAIFCILEIVTNTLLPTISWALTSGPTAPEATSFEPVDTTDMVNLASGDLAYNIPLLEVPGPSGGYPLSLSYHAGIQPNEEASWVGLGWTLNPGALTRNVNGFADDHKEKENVSRTFWAGGNTETWSAGITAGIANSPASVSAGLSFSQDTYQGSGIGMNAGIGMDVNGTPFKASAQVGISPYGDPYASAGVGASTNESISLGTEIGISTNFETISGYANGSASLVGGSISTSKRGTFTSASVVGVTIPKNSLSGIVSTSSNGVTIPIPTPIPGLSVSLGYNFQRYKIDQTEKIDVNGALYYPNEEVTKEWLDNHEYDTYSLLDQKLEGGIVDNPDPDKVLGGSFPNFDNYLVHAQGLSGNLRPYYFQKHLVKRNGYNVNNDGDRTYQTFHYQFGSDLLKPEFRFIGDFSNKFKYAQSKIDHWRPVTSEATKPLYYDFNQGPGSTEIGESSNERYLNNRLPGSRHIEYFTNKEIAERSQSVTDAQFIETKSSGFKRAIPIFGQTHAFYQDNIGGFVITNESGVRYHFSLPAYSYDEYMYSGKKEGTETFNELYKNDPYAYTWYLTAITGPDYVDRSPTGQADGILNKYDYGYWVEFEYGKWTDEYPWRNPSNGMTSDVDGNFENFSEGKKEIYYLDAIRTRSHTAIFVKDIRNDGKSVIYAERSITNKGSKGNKLILNDISKEGRFTPKTLTATCNRNFRLLLNQSGSLTYLSKPKSLLKLDEIILLSNDDLTESIIKKDHPSSLHEENLTYNWSINDNDNIESICSDCETCDFSSVSIKSHFPNNVIDREDEIINNLKNRAIRVIKFNSDYSLCPRTPNSFDTNSTLGDNPSEFEWQYTKTGKLTLNALEFCGKNGVSGILPKLKFGYDLSEIYSGKVVEKDLHFFKRYSIIVDASIIDEFLPGDILKLNDQDRIVYAYINEIQSNELELTFIYGSNIETAGVITFTKTKNPPYRKDAYDQWGLYKSDYDDGNESITSNLAHRTSDISSQSTDVWSLRSITTSLGAKIELNYESDSYKKPVLYESSNLLINEIKKNTDGTFSLRLHESSGNLNSFLKPNDQVKYNFLIGHAWYETENGSCQTATKKGFVSEVLSGELTIYQITNHNDIWFIHTYSDLNSAFVKKDATNYYRERESCISDVVTEYFVPALLAGNLSSSSSIENAGGGIRVKSVAISSFDKKVETRYDYNSSDGNTSGVTSYEPTGLDQTQFQFPDDAYFSSEIGVTHAKNEYKKKLYREFSDLLANSREVPPPGVIYESVGVATFFNNNAPSSYTLYNFQVFENGQVGIDYDEDRMETQSNENYKNYVTFNKKKTRNVTLKDFTSKVGSLKRVALYGENGALINETRNLYLDDNVKEDLLSQNYEGTNLSYDAYKIIYEQRLNTFNNQGIIEETYSDARFAKEKDGTFTLQGVVTKRETFPSVQIGQTTTNLKTGITTTSRTLAFDFYSGQAVKTLATDGYGNSYVSEVTPAYRIEAYKSGMGLAALGGKNMLTQEAYSKTFKVIPTNPALPIDKTNYTPVGLVSASAQTWSDAISSLHSDETGTRYVTQTGIWRKRAAYSFIGNDEVAMDVNGLLPVSDFSDFSNWSHAGTTPATWQKNSEITKYDVYSHALEAMDVNGDYAATKMDSKQERVFATVANAKYNEFAYAGAEDEAVNNMFGGEVVRVGAKSSVKSHTGSYSVVANAGLPAFKYTATASSDRKFIASVWSDNSNISFKYKINGGAIETATLLPVKQAGAWYLLSTELPIIQENSTLEVWCEATTGTTYFDDFRVHPFDAAMISYVYNGWGELKYILDNNNIFTEYNYDDMGRLVSTYRESINAAYGVNGRVKVSGVSYNYGRNVVPQTVNLSVTQSGPTGTVMPMTEGPVPKHSTLTYAIVENCPNLPTLQDIKIDGQSMGTTTRVVALADGTTVRLSNTSIILENLSGSHTVVVTFGEKIIWSGEPGVVFCETIEWPDGSMCKTGNYKFAYYSECGALGPWEIGSAVPTDLAHLAEGLVCTNPENSFCVN